MAACPALIALGDLSKNCVNCINLSEKSMQVYSLE